MSAPIELATVWPFLALAGVVGLVFVVFASKNVAFSLLLGLLLFATHPSVSDKPRPKGEAKGELQWLDSSFISVGFSTPLRCFDSIPVLGRQCQPDTVVVGALNRWHKVSLQTASVDLAAALARLGAATRGLGAVLREHVLEPVKKQLAPSYGTGAAKKPEL